LVHQVDDDGAAALEAAERLRADCCADAPGAPLGARLADGLREIADALSRLRATLALLQDSPRGFQHAVASDLVAAQTWRTTWLANIASLISAGTRADGRARPLSAIIDGVVEAFEPECRL